MYNKRCHCGCGCYRKIWNVFYDVCIQCTLGEHQKNLKETLKKSNFDENVSIKLKSLLEMTQDQYEGITTRWDEIKHIAKFDLKNSDDFKIGFVFGKMESKFISWFYSIHARSLSDHEYTKFWHTVRNFTKKLE